MTIEPFLKRYVNYVLLLKKVPKELNKVLVMRCICFGMFLLMGCFTNRVPDAELSQYDYTAEYVVNTDGIHISLTNPLHCPLRVWVSSEDKNVDAFLREANPVVLPPLSDTVIYHDYSSGADEDVIIYFASRLGDSDRVVIPDEVRLPFPKGKSYVIVQGNNSLPTHNKESSRHAIDFGLNLKDTVCSATDGYVVGMIDDYRYGGPEEKWLDYSNFITIYDPGSGLFTQYAHLFHKGSFVEVGDQVRAGDPIGLAGMTGQTNIEHLHFNCLVPEYSEHGLKSVPVVFEGGLEGVLMKRGDRIVHK